MSKEIVIATGNPGKLDEFRKILGSETFHFKTLKDIQFHADIVEDGDTFEANALIKARTIHQFHGGSVLADDSGLEVDALGGAPGIYTARFAGVGASDEANHQKLLKELQGVTEDSDRGAKFVCVLAFINDQGEEFLFRGEVPGLIVRKPRGDQGFGYDPVFAPIRINEQGQESTEKTFAQMSHQEKKADSHRGRAIAKLSKSNLL
tara:strand:+ start:743 stop:1360 length:618 start_codon:yes stop_codon:yes gene_type:complete